MALQIKNGLKKNRFGIYDLKENYVLKLPKKIISFGFCKALINLGHNDFSRNEYIWRDRLLSNKKRNIKKISSFEKLILEVLIETQGLSEKIKYKDLGADQGELVKIFPSDQTPSGGFETWKLTEKGFSREDGLSKLDKENLTEKERKIISLRFGLDSSNRWITFDEMRTIAEVAEHMNCSREYCRQVLESVSTKVRKAVKKDAKDKIKPIKHKNNNLVLEIERLANLRERGLLSDQEFTIAKRKLLS